MEASGEGKWPRRLAAAALAVGGATAIAYVLYKKGNVKAAPSGAKPTAPAKPASGSSSGKQQLTGLAAQRAAAMKEAAAEEEDGPIEERVDKRLRAQFKPQYLEVINQGGSCSAPKLGILMVSESFAGKKRIDRQREVQSLLRGDLDANYIHAISMQLKTPEEKAEYDKRMASEQ
mmetsp:Transcript_15058/g.35382  ORF Transcript_15058/g.35382 Transcript_15058/m.35382 type:complete len:175 (+) Transcript_15058:69-593(+)